MDHWIIPILESSPTALVSGAAVWIIMRLHVLQKAQDEMNARMVRIEMWIDRYANHRDT